MISNIFSVKDKKILITGASAGLGAHYARILSQAGAHLILTGRREELLIKLAKEIETINTNVSIVPLDILDFATVEKKMQQIFDEKNGIDVLINNAGFSPKIKKTVFENNLSDWDQIIDTNLKSMWFLTKITAQDMQKRNIIGSIINISSTVANRSRLGNPIYGISKEAVVSLTKKYALEFAKFNIRVNAIAPGFFETDINRHFINSTQGQEVIARTIPFSRIGRYDELNGVIFLLASNASSYMTGECIYIDGGYIINSIS